MLKGLPPMTPTIAMPPTNSGLRKAAANAGTASSTTTMKVAVAVNAPARVRAANEKDNPTVARRMHKSEPTNTTLIKPRKDGVPESPNRKVRITGTTKNQRTCSQIAHNTPSTMVCPESGVARTRSKKPRRLSPMTLDAACTAVIKSKIVQTIPSEGKA